jgi:hypothetical protein
MQPEMKQAYEKSGLAPKKDGTAPSAKTSAGMAGLSGFWKFAVLFSFVVNAILFLVVLVLVGLLFPLKNAIASPLIGGLYDNFVLMDNAHIITTIDVSDTIQVNDSIPVVFDLPLNTATVVTLTADTPIRNTTVYLNGLPIPTDIVLPAGTPLSIQLNLSVPVSTTVPVVLNVPVHLNVPVDIALNQTQLDTPFKNLAALVAPYDALLDTAPSSWKELFLGK